VLLPLQETYAKLAGIDLADEPTPNRLESGSQAETPGKRRDRIKAVIAAGEDPLTILEIQDRLLKRFREQVSYNSIYKIVNSDDFEKYEGNRYHVRG
jgi:hypothetical protein